MAKWNPTYRRTYMFLSDTAPYVVKAANCLQAFYPNMVHVTCVVHELHRVVEKIHG